MAFALPTTIPLPSMRKPYRSLALFVGGFSQCQNASNGMHVAKDNTYRDFANPRTLIEYRSWLVDPADTAAWLWEFSNETLRETHERLKIAIISYSFGGFTAAEIAREFWKISPLRAGGAD